MSGRENVTLLIDNYDSFTYNVYQYLCEIGATVHVARNDQISLDECKRMNPSRVVISPGPGGPADAGVSNDVIREFGGKIPVFGICLGHQCIFEVFGGTVTHAKNEMGVHEIVHGKTARIDHDQKGAFRDIPTPCDVIRYHSLAGVKSTLPKELLVTCKTSSGIIMGVRHREYTIEGVQFHPESILTKHGKVMLKNFLRLKSGRWDRE